MGTWLKETLFYELAETKGLFVQVLVISIAFGILKNFTDVFDNSYISELCFVLVYSVLAVLLMRSFLVMSDLTKETDRYHGGIYADPDPGVWHVNGVFQWYGNGGGFL